ncbi:MAG: hypothetical protein R2749_22530 [Acidimicrobiales bacterium]
MEAPEHPDGWRGEVRARWPLLVVGALVAIGAVQLVTGPLAVRVLGAAFVVGGALLAVFCRVVVVADEHGLTVRFGWWRRPAVHLGIERMATAEVIDVRPLHWGGWGYRGSLKLFRRAAVVLRGGEGLQVTLRDGRVFVVTVDDAAGAVAVLRRAIAAHPG